MGAFDLIVGVYLLGILFNTFLYGLVCYQFIQYYSLRFNDPLWIRTVVGALFALDTLHSAVELYAAWEMCVTNYANPAALAFVSWTIPFTACATAVAAMITQIFLCHRVYILSRSYVIPGIIIVLSAVSCVFGNVAGVKSGILKEVARFGELKPFVICWLAFQTTADILLTSSLSYVLAKSKTGFARTDSVINRIIRGAVQTGLFASMFAMGDLFSFLFANQTNLYAMFAFPLGRIYTNTLLDTLICRKKLKNSNITTVDTETGLQFNSRTDIYRLKTKRSHHTFNSIQIQQDVVTDRTYDSGPTIGNDQEEVYSETNKT